MGPALLAILPGVALQELWGLVGVAEKALLAVSGFVVVVGLSGMLITNFTRRNSRKDKLTEKADDLMDRFNRLLKPCLGRVTH